MSFKILVVDDQMDDLEVTKSILSVDPEFDVITTTDPDQAIHFIRQNPNDVACVLLDYHMPKDGLTTAKEIFSVNPDLSIAILSADQTREALKKSIEIGVHSFIDKDEDSEILLAIVRSLCQKWKNKIESLSELEESTSEDSQKYISSFSLIGKSSKMLDVCRLIDRAAKSDCTVMIMGESGSGKELIARAIHQKSKRKDKPFVAININAINENLIESELFGHVKGAFTGATEDKAGKLVAAHGGTLFLDEIGDLKLESQVKLLRVLQERKVTPVGSNRVINFDIRIITATHINLEKAIANGKFREDLYYRLHVFPIHNPPLRDRTEDIPPLLHHFFKKYSAAGEAKPKILMDTVRLLQRYSWNGNVRELENEVQRLIALGYKQIEPSHLKEKILASLNFQNSDNNMQSYSDLQKNLWQIELDYLERHVKTEGSIAKASQNIFKAPKSSIHWRINNLKETLNKPSLQSQDLIKPQGEFYE